MKKFLLIVILLSQSVFFNNVVKADLANPVEIINGGIMPYTNNTTDNWYAFTMVTDSTVWIIGSDNTGRPIYYTFIYDENLVRLAYLQNSMATTLNLNAGKYYINISESTPGSFSIYSTDMGNPSETNPVSGSIANPRLMENGVSVPFGAETAANVYYFETTTLGNVNVSGSANTGDPIYYTFIYDDNLVRQASLQNSFSTTLNLNAGKYYLVMMANSGNISVFTPVFNPDPEPPVPPYLDGYNNGYDEGKQFVIDNYSQFDFVTISDKEQAVADAEAEKEKTITDLTEYSSFLLKGDFDLDGDIDAFDLIWFSGEFGQIEINVDNDGDTYSEVQGDCNDMNNSVNPDASEQCDGIDNNCNGLIDEGCE